MYDWLIVGAGFSGAVLAERIATQLDQRVLVIDRRPHAAGNAHDFLDAAGVLVHGYGPHIFHTNAQRVWDYLSRFTAWRPYEHRVRAAVEDKQIPVPFNLTSLAMLLPAAAAKRLEDKVRRCYAEGAQVPMLKMLEHRDAELRQLARHVYETIFLGYTIKQWALRPEELAPSVTGRIPIRINRDDRYFLDRFQAMPADGYTRLFQRLLNHRNIRVELGVDWRELPRSVRYKRMAYTGPIDAFFDYAYGPLAYRSVRLEFQTLEQERVQEVAQINYPDGQPYTRQTEFKHMTGQRLACTSLSREFPQPHVPGQTEPFYPIPRQQNRAIFQKYRREAMKLGRSVVFCGRLADYQYYNMDQIVGRALGVFEQEIAADESRLRHLGEPEPKVAAA